MATVTKPSTKTQQIIARVLDIGKQIAQLGNEDVWLITTKKPMSCMSTLEAGKEPPIPLLWTKSECCCAIAARSWLASLSLKRQSDEAGKRVSANEMGDGVGHRFLFADCLNGSS